MFIYNIRIFQIQITNQHTYAGNPGYNYYLYPSYLSIRYYFHTPCKHTYIRKKKNILHICTHK